MAGSRRRFLKGASLGLVGMAAGCHRGSEGAGQATTPSVSAPAVGSAPAGMPPAFGTAPPVGPEITKATFAEAEKLMQVGMSDADLQQAAGNWRSAMAPLYERRVGPRKVAIEAAIAPYSVCDPVKVSGGAGGPTTDHFVRSKGEVAALPTEDREIAFAPLTQLSRWVEGKKITSERLTGIYLDRIERFNPTLRCAITAPSPTPASAWA